ncbi:hypothetical protein OQA88_806 [Cercophora sp. LCS_1]
MANTLLDLPLNILHLILDEFCHGRKWDDIEQAIELGRAEKHRGRWPDREKNADITNMRLTCRVFNHLASPLLLPCLDISIDQKSLDLAATVIKNELIASGIRVVRVNLAYRPAALLDPAAFPSSIYRMVRDFKFELMRRHPIAGWIAEQKLNIPGEHEWRPRSVATNAELFKPIHAAYREAQAAQESLLASGAFVKTVAKIMTQLPSAATVWFTDEVTGFTPEIVKYIDDLLQFEENTSRKLDFSIGMPPGFAWERPWGQRLGRPGMSSEPDVPGLASMPLADTGFLAGPRPWHHVEDLAEAALASDDHGRASYEFMCNSITRAPPRWRPSWLSAPATRGRPLASFPELPVLRVLSDLPLELDRLGVELRHLRIDCLPFHKNHPSLLPLSGSYAGVRHALRHLETLTVEGDVDEAGNEAKKGGKELTSLERFFEAAVAGGAKMKHLKVREWTFEIMFSFT